MTKKKAANRIPTGMAGMAGMVGYGRPPKHAQFKKGTSGNPKGRPKGAPNLKALLQATFDQKVAVVVNGKSTKVPLIQALMMKEMALAMAGNQGAMKMAFDLYSSAHPPMNDNQPMAIGSSFELSPEEFAAISKSSLLKGLK